MTLKEIQRFDAIAGVVIAVGMIFLSGCSGKEIEPKKNEVSQEAMVERGRYLATNVAACIDCHSIHDWSYYAGPIVPGTEGKGGERFGPEFGIPGVVYSKNITPAALGEWTDEEIIRAMREGRSKDSTILFPLMPYTHYRLMSDEDARAVVAFIRTLPSTPNQTPARELPPPVEEMLQQLPQPATPMTVDQSDVIAYGRYLVIMADCGTCHTPMQNGQPIPEMEFAGGYEFTFPFGVTRSANITPDSTNGIGLWTRELFINSFKTYSPERYKPSKLDEEDPTTPMPWLMYSGMTEEDLGAIYAYLRTLKPINNPVEKFSAAE